MSRGIKLTSQEDLENAAAKSNMFYLVAVSAGIILGVMSGQIVLLVALFLVVALIIQSEYLKWKIRGFRKMEFWKLESLTQEEILQKTSESFSRNGIQVILENGQLVFKHDSILYDYENVEKGVFRLNWGYTLGKALFSFDFISNYKTVRKDTAYIVSMIQNISVEEAESVNKTKE